MQAANLPALAGLRWALDGWILFRRQPLAMFTWAMLVGLVMMVAAALAPIGPLLFMALMPVVTVISIAAARRISEGQTMQLGQWSEPLQRPGVFKKLTGLGSLFMGLSLLAGLAAFLPYADTLRVAVDTAMSSDDPLPLMMAVRAPLIIFGVLYIILATLFWYAPPLVAFHDTRLVQSLFYSTVACWRNKWAFLVYGVVVGGAFMALELIGVLLVVMGVPGQWVLTLRTPLNIVLGAVIYCSLYTNYASVFLGTRDDYDGTPPDQAVDADEAQPVDDTKRSDSDATHADNAATRPDGDTTRADGDTTHADTSPEPGDTRRDDPARH